ncbi:hypothetical protein DEU56DRAFT_919683 [Suillus clintonianus]|uniref:uncharacterized protein n=1 Tax=Suillus clintonianus TaxID=1904413 RepID=UPI001B869B77|nr:uncharacterized protein DEU56DRAFT_919683 [Suillus clintonianus]KAG2113680.1 hypothetical protein DEU56DRAFT_919683 [Suillus clintonianus]
MKPRAEQKNIRAYSVINLEDDTLQSIASLFSYKKANTNEKFHIAKLPPRKIAHPRGPDGRFFKRTTETVDPFNFTSEESSPLDTPEIRERALEQDPSLSEQEVNQQLADDEDADSLQGAPEPDTVIPFQFPALDPPKAPAITAKPHIQQNLTATPKETSVVQTVATSNKTSTNPIRMAGMPEPSIFYGRDDENPQNFFKSVERYIYLNRVSDDATKVIIFSTFISAGSEADIWWSTLDTAKKVTLDLVKAVFEVQWPATVIAKKSKLEYQKELLVLRLKEEEVGERITAAGVSTWSHLHYHSRLQKLVQDAGVANAPVFIHQVREALPRVIRDLTSPAPNDWVAFLDEIKNADINIIQDKARREKEKRDTEKAQNARIARLESKQPDPMEILHLQMQQTSIGTVASPTAPIIPQQRITATPSYQNTPAIAQRSGRYVAANQPTTTPQRPRAQPPTPEEQDAMRARVGEWTHQPDMPTGQATYEDQIRQWGAKWGVGARCTESTPYPLTPGTAHICSGECFRCGTHGHIGPACQIPPDGQLPQSESIWRSHCTRILGTFNCGTAPQINYVIDNTYAAQAWEQGNGEGLST